MPTILYLSICYNYTVYCIQYTLSSTYTAMIYSAILHERNHRSQLFMGEALNCVASAYNPHKIIKMCVDTDSNLSALVARCRRNFSRYLSPSEVIKIVEPSGEIVAIIRSAEVS